MWRDGGWRALNGVEEKKGLRFRTYVVPVRMHREGRVLVSGSFHAVKIKGGCAQK